MTEGNENNQVSRNRLTEFIGKTNIYVLYSILFAVISAVVFSEFIIKDLSFVNKGDGFNQHVRALLYYGRYLRDIAGNLIRHHEIIIPQWDFSIAEGGDILNTFQYYAIGDPLNIISAFIPDKNIGYTYSFISLLRMYLSGITFLMLCREMGKECSKPAVILGTLSYVFGYYAINSSGGNVFDVDYLMYFPLLVLGLEKIVRGKRMVVLILAVFFAGISNTVLFSVMGILMGMYTIVRFIYLYLENRDMVMPAALKTFCAVAIGAAMSAAVTFPSLYSLLNNPRSGIDYKVLPVIPVEEILEIPGNILSGVDASYGFFGMLLPVIVLSFCIAEKKISRIRTLIVFLWIMLFIPAFSNAVNFFSGYERRWGFLFSFIYSCLIVFIWDRLDRFNTRNALISAAGIAVVFILVVLTGNLKLPVMAGLLTAAAFTLILLFMNKKGSVSRTAVLASAVIIIILTDMTSLHCDIDDERFRKAGSMLERINANETAFLAEEAEGKTFFRYTGNTTINAGTTAGFSSTSYYWSNINPAGLDFRNDLELTGSDPISYGNYNFRSVAQEIAGCGFLVKGDDKERLPYGYEYVKKADVNEKLREMEGDAKEKVIELYKNPDPLPFAYTYDDYVNYSGFSGLNAVEKEQTMLKSVIIPDEAAPEGFERGVAADNVHEIPFRMEPDENIIIEDKRLITYEPYSCLTLEFDCSEAEETMINLRNIRFKPVYNYHKYYGDKETYDPENRYTDINALPLKDRIGMLSEDLKKLGSYTQVQLELEYGNEETVRYVQRTPYEKKYNGRDSVVFNLGFTDRSSVNLIFIKPGIYEFDTGVYNVSFEDYESDVNKRTEYVLENVEFDTDRVSGTIDIPEKKLLFLCLPYAEGWKAYVDGEEARILKANDMYSALALDKGKHEILLKYHTPMRTAGWVVTLVSWILFLIIILKDRVIKKSAEGYIFF